MKIALITGIGGQDGSYLAELLLSKGYQVYGLKRPGPNTFSENLSAIASQLTFVPGDLSDPRSLRKIIDEVHPDEVYNLAAQSSSRESWKDPHFTFEMNALAVLYFLDAIRAVDTKIKFFQASSAEMFGKVGVASQSELTPFHPRNPYGVAKLSAYWSCLNDRDHYGLFTCNGIFFNHESPRRRKEFVTRKISDGLVRVKLGLEKELRLGTLDTKRDWGFAGDYVEAMWLMLQQEVPEDYVIATGATHTVREFVEQAAIILGMNIEWRGKGVDEIGIDTVSGRTVIIIDPKFYNPGEANFEVGDATKAKTKLGWEPRISFQELVRIMVNADMGRLGGK
jgi:GDPmannose 4,6-dehydratase